MINWIKNLFKNNDPVINFACNNWGVRKYAPIQPAGKFFPEKFKKMSPYFEDGKAEHNIDSLKTVRVISSRLYEHGFVIRLRDITTSHHLMVNLNRYSDEMYKDAFHPDEQLQGLMKEKFSVRGAVKLDNPWFTWNKPGWSTLYLPMYYHQDRNWEAVPGVMDHDLGAPQSPINIMLKEIKPTTIKMGEPIVQVIPFKRETQIARTMELNETVMKRQWAISSLHKMTYAGWIKWVKAKKLYKVDARDTNLPGD